MSKEDKIIVIHRFDNEPEAMEKIKADSMQIPVVEDVEYCFKREGKEDIKGKLIAHEMQSVAAIIHECAFVMAPEGNMLEIPRRFLSVYQNEKPRYGVIVKDIEKVDEQGVIVSFKRGEKVEIAWDTLTESGSEINGELCWELLGVTVWREGNYRLLPEEIVILKS